MFQTYMYNNIEQFEVIVYVSHQGTLGKHPEAFEAVHPRCEKKTHWHFGIFGSWYSVTLDKTIKHLFFQFNNEFIYFKLSMFHFRTANIRWSYVVSNFGQVLACLLYTYYIFERFCVPVFQNFNQDHVSMRVFLISMFNCMLPGTLVLLIG